MSQKDVKLSTSLCYRCRHWDWIVKEDKDGRSRGYEHSCVHNDSSMQPGDRVSQCIGFELNPNRGAD